MSDIAGLLIGLLRRLTGGGTGQQRFTGTGQRVNEQASQLRNMPEQLLQLIEEFPGYVQPLSTRADVELESGDNEAALRTAELLRQRFPGLIAGYWHGCTALRRLKRFPEAEAMARAAMLRFPRAPGGFEGFANCAQEQGNWPEAAARWQVAARRFPQALWAQMMHASSLARVQRFDAAEQAIARTIRTWPDEMWPRHFAADIAEQAGDWATAASRWHVLRQRFPGRTDAYVRGARALRQAGALAEAGELIAVGIYMFPRDPAMRAEYEAVRAAGGDPGPEPET